MYSKRRVKSLLYIAIIVLISFVIFLASNQTPTGFSTAQPINPKVAINLTKNNYTSGDPILGNIRIDFNGVVDPSLTFEADIGGTDVEKTIPELLTLLNKSSELSEAVSTGTNPQTSKLLSLSGTQPSLVAFYFPQAATLSPIVFNFAIPSSSLLKFPKVDVGNDNIIEWEYLGKIAGWGSTIMPSGVTQPDTSSSSGLISDSKIYCEIMNFPKATDFYVGARYRRVNKSADLRAAILIIDPFSGQAPGSSSISPVGSVSAYTCDLQEHDDMKWSYCSISMDSAIRGNNLVCIYSPTLEDGEMLNLYEIPLEGVSTLSQTSYYCDSTGSSCSLISQPQKFYLRLQAGTYDGTLNSTMQFNFGDYYTRPSDNGMDFITYSVQEYLSQCTPDSLGKCTVPIAFLSESSGQVSLSSLSIPYTVAFSQIEHNFYDLAQESVVIKKIGTVDLASVNFTLSFSLSKLGNFSAASTTVPIVKDAEVKIGNSNDLKMFLVMPVGYQPSVSTTGTQQVEALLTETKTILEALQNPDEDQDKIMALLSLKSGITSGLSMLDTYETSLQAIKEGKGEVNITDLKEDIESFRSNQIKDILIESSLTDNVVVEPDDITEDIVPADKKEETAILQEKVDMQVSVKKYSLKQFDGTAQHGRLVGITISPKEQLGSIDVFVKVRKEAVENVINLKFEKSPDRIINPDPVVKWFFPKLEKEKESSITFLAETDKEVTPTDFKIIIAKASEDEGECTADSDCGEGYTCQENACIATGEGTPQCGDGVCTTPLEDSMICPQDCIKKLPWITIILVLIGAILIGTYINLYRGKGSFRELTRGKNPFNNEEDMLAVIKYIKVSLDKPIKIEEIGKVLIEKGWTSKQINFCFEELQWVKSLDDVVKIAPEKGLDLAPMKLYVEKAILKGMKKKDIIDNLAAKGWDASKVKSAYRGAKMKLAWNLLLKKLTFSKKTYK